MLDQFLLHLKHRERTRHFLFLTDEDHPVGGQLMGAEPDQFAAGAKRLVAEGFDIIDINFGCPVKKVLGKCRGGFHLSQPETALEIVRRTRQTVPDHIPVTLKMRRGIDDSNASRDKFFEILEGAFQIGIAAATVHGRSVKQRYMGPSNWSFLREVKQQFAHHIILGSGDLFTADDCLRMMRQTGVDGVTVARGAIGNPWIFEQVRALAGGQIADPPAFAEQRQVMQRALSSGRTTLRSGSLRCTDAEIRHQVCTVPPAAGRGSRRLHSYPLPSGLGTGARTMVRESGELRVEGGEWRVESDASAGDVKYAAGQRERRTSNFE